MEKPVYTFERTSVPSEYRFEEHEYELKSDYWMIDGTEKLVIDNSSRMCRDYVGLLHEYLKGIIYWQDMGLDNFNVEYSISAEHNGEALVSDYANDDTDAISEERVEAFFEKLSQLDEPFILTYEHTHATSFRFGDYGLSFWKRYLTENDIAKEFVTYSFIDSYDDSKTVIENGTVTVEK